LRLPRHTPRFRQGEGRDHRHLASDADGKVCGAYGVWVEKSMYGKTYMGIERSTFLVDGKGVIRNVWRKVKVDGHAEEVLKAAAALK
jgi:peroxiredoxin Q/BCP